MFAVIHPIERFGGLAEVAAIVPSYGSHLNPHALRDVSDVVDDGFRLLWFPRVRLIIVLPHLVSTRKKKAEHWGIPVTVQRVRTDCAIKYHAHRRLISDCCGSHFAKGAYLCNPARTRFSGLHPIARLVASQRPSREKAHSGRCVLARIGWLIRIESVSRRPQLGGSRTPNGSVTCRQRYTVSAGRFVNSARASVGHVRTG
jgi:hypothetical protein